MQEPVGEVTLRAFYVELLEHRPLSGLVFLYSGCLRTLVMFRQVTLIVAVTRDRGSKVRTRSARPFSSPILGLRRVIGHRTSGAG